MKAKALLIPLLVILLALDLYLVGQIHFARLGVIKKADVSVKESLRQRAKILTFVFISVNAAGVSVLLFMGFRWLTASSERP